MNQAQLNSALQELETALRDGEAELKKRPDQFHMVKTLHAELKKAKPGHALPPKLATLLKNFLAKHIDEEIRVETKAFKEAKAAGGPVMTEVAGAHKSVLNALSVARNGLGVLDPGLPQNVVDDAATRMKNANTAAQLAVGNAAAAAAFAPKQKSSAPVKPPAKK
jgi:hypothetical protein